VKELNLDRRPTERATPGHLFFDGRFLCYTLEPPWKDNKTSISCIPDGDYTCMWHNSPRFGWLYTVLDVPGRTNIHIHVGNTLEDTYGCILPGGGYMNDALITDSGNAKSLIEATIGGHEDFLLKIRHGFRGIDGRHHLHHQKGEMNGQ